MKTTTGRNGQCEYRAVFPATSAGIEAAQMAGDQLPALWSGLAAESRRVAVGARALVWWLAVNESPGTPIALGMRYEPLRGELRLCAQDAGRTLPVALAGDALRLALAEADGVGGGAAFLSGGRMVHCRLRLNRVVLRMRWCVAAGAEHPAVTYQGYADTALAEQAAMSLWDLEPPSGAVLDRVDLGRPTSAGAMRWSGRAQAIGAAA